MLSGGKGSGLTRGKTWNCFLARSLTGYFLDFAALFTDRKGILLLLPLEEETCLKSLEGQL